MMGNVFVSADWSNVEGRLTAYFSGDETLQRMLDEELEGGHSVHSKTAAILYNIDPGDAKTHKINLKGNMVPARDGGKRLRHAWHYGLKPKNMADQFWITRKEAERINEVLSEMHPGVVAWWKELGDEVFGVHRYICPRCGGQQTLGGECQGCAGRPGRYSPTVKWDGWERPPTRVLYTPFGRRRIYLGRRAQSMNALISQRPQSCGASMWYRTLCRLHWGLAAHLEHIENLVFRGSYDDLTRVDSHATLVNTGTYDSFLLQCPVERRDDVLQWLAWTMEQPWTQLGGLRIPVEMKTGQNWREFDEQSNPSGLKGVEYIPFTASNP